MPTVSTIIIVKNEAHNIEECIKSILWTDEIVILDSGSTDGTQAICKKFLPKVKLYETDWPGFGTQKNRALNLASSEWILSIDADERVTNELKTEILNKLSSTQHTAFIISRRNYFLNKPLKYCCSDDAHIRLAKKNHCEFSKHIVHESILVNSGTIGKITNKIKHFSYISLENRITKMNYYSTLGADILIKNNKKTNHFIILIKTIWEFIRVYFLRLGFLDGWPGFIIALSNSEGKFYKYAKLMENRKE